MLFLNSILYHNVHIIINAYNFILFELINENIKTDLKTLRFTSYDVIILINIKNYIEVDA